MFQDRFPFLTANQPTVRYELGVAVLLLWVGETMHHASEVATRYPKNYWIWTLVDDHDLDRFIPWYCVIAALLISGGLLRLVCGCSNGRLLRAAGFVLASSLFLFIAIGHITISFYTVGGAPYLFLAWRFLELAASYARR